MACPGVVRSKYNDARLRQSHYVRLTMPWQASLFALLRSKPGGGRGIRTPDLLNAIQALYQLSYTPRTKQTRSVVSLPTCPHCFAKRCRRAELYPHKMWNEVSCIVVESQTDCLENSGEGGECGICRVGSQNRKRRAPALRSKRKREGG